ncbi:hypothetical protein [Paracoccus sp. (in: a-proteobacteria)]|uniref:hypothetical protein n=1 Tax=Paracoccus sp. TaxID=267 RepID=UPI002897DFC9|nr:hypothetical protein [Paracoccus sp. (in: a-proteobacteria)]
MPGPTAGKFDRARDVSGILRWLYGISDFRHSRFTRFARRIPHNPWEKTMLSDVLFLVGGLALFVLAAVAVRAADRL